MAGVVVGGPGDDAEIGGGHRRRARQGDRLLDVETLADEHAAETEFFGPPTLVDEIARVLGAAREHVEAQFGRPGCGNDAVGRRVLARHPATGTGAGIRFRMNTAARTRASVASGTSLVNAG